MPGKKASSHTFYPTHPNPQLSPSGPQLPQLAFLAMGYSQLSQDKEKV